MLVWIAKRKQALDYRGTLSLVIMYFALTQFVLTLARHNTQPIIASWIRECRKWTPGLIISDYLNNPNLQSDIIVICQSWMQHKKNWHP